MDEDLAYSYSLLWKGILNQNESDIEKASKLLGVKNYFIFAAMVTNKDWGDIMDKQQKDQFKRLHRETNSVTKEDTQTKFNLYMEEIVKALQEVHPDILLILKVNDYLRAIDGKLGNPANSFLHIARYSCNTVANYEIKKYRLGWMKRFNLYLEQLWLIIKLKMYKYHLEGQVEAEEKERRKKALAV